MKNDLPTRAIHNRAAYLITTYLNGRSVVQGEDILQICHLIKAAYISSRLSSPSSLMEKDDEEA